MPAEDLHASSRERDHLAAAQGDNQGHSGGSGMDLKYSGRRSKPTRPSARGLVLCLWTEVISPSHSP